MPTGSGATSAYAMDSFDQLILSTIPTTVTGSIPSIPLSVMHCNAAPAPGFRATLPSAKKMLTAARRETPMDQDIGRQNEPIGLAGGHGFGQPTIAKLFFLCLRVGLISFGGGLTGWFYRELVILRGWVSEEDFYSSQAVAQMLPGPNIANLVICLGEQLCGSPGALACCTGIFIGPFFCVIALNFLFERFSGIDAIQVGTSGIAFAAIGLMWVICLRGIRRAMKFPPSLLVVAATAIAVGVFHWPLLPVVLSMGAISVGLAWRRISHEE